MDTFAGSELRVLISFPISILSRKLRTILLIASWGNSCGLSYAMLTNSSGVKTILLLSVFPSLNSPTILLSVHDKNRNGAIFILYHIISI